MSDKEPPQQTMRNPLTVAREERWAQMEAESRLFEAHVKACGGIEAYLNKRFPERAAKVKDDK